MKIKQINLERNPPFQLIRKGWGEFPVHVQIHFKDSRNKRIDLNHQLKLDWTQTGLQTFGGECSTQTQLIIKPNDFINANAADASQLNSQQQLQQKTFMNDFDSINNINNNNANQQSQNLIESNQTSLKRTLSSSSLSSNSSLNNNNSTTIIDNQKSAVQLIISSNPPSTSAPNTSSTAKPSLDALLNLRPLNQITKPVIPSIIKPVISCINRSQLISNPTIRIPLSTSSSSVTNCNNNNSNNREGTVIYKIGANDLKNDDQLSNNSSR